MALPMFARALRPTSTTASPQSFICNACTKRHESTYRRTRKALRVKPHPDFLPSKTEPADHIIFNPPSSAPSVYHTPPKFLPASDPRRKLHTPASLPPKATGSSTTSVSSLPPVRPPSTKKYHLTQTEIDEIRRLRTSDPHTWTRVRLAEKFECSQFFISLCCAAPAEIRQQQAKDLAEIKRKWGRRKTEAREARQERKTWWGKDL